MVILTFLYNTTEFYDFTILLMTNANYENQNDTKTTTKSQGKPLIKTLSLLTAYTITCDFKTKPSNFILATVYLITK